MLKFFRKIRQNLLNKGKTTKYFKYAIGEIVLVVIGILIALSINTWNETRKDKLEERAILENLQNDLENTIAEFEFLNTLRKDAIDASLHIFELSTDIQKNSKYELDTLFGKTMIRPTYNGKMGTLELLFSTGKISLIQNEEIKAKLISWPGMIDDFKEEEVYANEIFMGTFIAELAKYAVIAELFNTLDGNSFIASTYTNQKYRTKELSMKGDFSQLLKNKEFLNHMALRNANFFVSYTEAISLIDHANQLKKLIQKELEQ